MATAILVVDPSPDTFRALQAAFAGEGVDFVHVATGNAAVRLLEGRPVDLIVAEQNFPDIRGADICRAVRANTFTGAIPVILLTDAAEPSERADALDLGALDLLVRPVDSAELRARVRSGLVSRQLQRDLEQQNSLLYQLHEFSLKLNALETVEDTMEATLICAVSLTFSRSASILLPEETGNQLRVARLLNSGPDDTLDRTVPVEGTAAGHVFQHGDVFVAGTDDEIAGDIAAGAGFPHRPPFVCVPIASEAGSLGVLTVADKATSAGYTDQDVKTLRCLATTAAVAIESQRRRLRLDRTRDAAMIGLAALAEWRDPETGDHLNRLREYAKLLAEGLAETDRYAGVIDREFVSACYRSIPLHDIGKVGIPDHILLKPGRLTPSEYEIMKTHAAVGATVLESMKERIAEDSFLDMARDIAKCHHEKYDGSGYPAGLVGASIPLAARIAAVADVYDALASDRVYRKAWSHERTVAYIRENSGTHFDPDVVEVLAWKTDEFLRLKTRLAEEEANRRTQQETPEDILA